MIHQNDTTTLRPQAESPILIAQSPPTVGSWQVLPENYNCPINPIHAALLHTGKVFFFAGSGNDPNNVSTPDGSAVLDVSTGSYSRPVTPLDDSGFPIDIFCADQSFLPDGRLIVAGGTEQYDPFHGLPAALVFDPITEQWTKLAPMNTGRWYPTVIMLGDGRVLALSGLDEHGLLDTYPEIYSAANNEWTYFTQPTSALQMYSHLFLLSSGKIFYSGAYFGGYTNVSPRILTLPTNRTQKITETPVSGLQAENSGNQAASVLLPPAEQQKVMIIGGGNGPGVATKRVTTSLYNTVNPYTTQIIVGADRSLKKGLTVLYRKSVGVNIVDLKATTPKYTPAASLNYARMHHNAVLLPDRTVFVCNGSGAKESAAKATWTAEIYNPATNTWTVAATASVTRLYHSLALLLPDGRVLTTGGNPDRLTQERQLEIYSPPYMSKPRPEITSAPEAVSYGGKITIGTPQASSIKWVSLIKPMATTHCLDKDQRLVNVNINSKTNTFLNVTVPSNRNLAPPGYYMLFITDRNNVPSVAKWIRVG